VNAARLLESRARAHAPIALYSYYLLSSVTSGPMPETTRQTSQNPFTLYSSFARFSL
jgi:hypothetical protein